MIAPLLHTQLLWLLLTCRRTVSICSSRIFRSKNQDRRTDDFLVCAIGGYMHYQGYDISSAQALIPKLQGLLQAFRSAGFPVYHTREGKPMLHFKSKIPSCLPNLPAKSSNRPSTRSVYSRQSRVVSLAKQRYWSWHWLSRPYGPFAYPWRDGS